MAEGDDIADKFASAVRRALKPSSPADQSSEENVEPGRRPKRRIWGIALICVAVAATVAIVVAAALHVRRADVARLAAEKAAMRPGSPPGPLYPKAAISQSTPAVSASTSEELTPPSPAMSPAASPTVSAATSATALAPVSLASPTGPAAAPTKVPGVAGATALPGPPTSAAPAVSPQTAGELPLAHGSPSPSGLRASAQTLTSTSSPNPRSTPARGDHHATPAGAASAGVHERGRPALQRTPLAQASSFAVVPEVQRQPRQVSPSPAAETTVAGAPNKQDSAGSLSSRQPASHPHTPPTVAAPTTRSTSAANMRSASHAAARFVLVMSPDHSVSWALEDSGTIFRSTDHKTWQKQDTGVEADLLAGQALSDKVCWVVGRNGTILLTTDGKRWQRIKSPSDADLVGVSAVSDDVVDVVAANGARFHTFDGGSTWQRTE